MFIKLTLCLVLIAMGASGPIAQADADFLTEYQGKEVQYECRPLDLNQSNVIGFMSIDEGDGTVSARVLYQSGRRSERIGFKMSAQQAQVLSHEIEALINKKRSRAIRFVSAKVRGECHIAKILS